MLTHGKESSGMEQKEQSLGGWGQDARFVSRPEGVTEWLLSSGQPNRQK